MKAATSLTWTPFVTWKFLQFLFFSCLSARYSIAPSIRYGTPTNSFPPNRINQLPPVGPPDISIWNWNTLHKKCSIGKKEFQD